ncbi:Mu-like prophage major head subunit gpT family protein [Candidatus Nitrotoga sp. M5]|uniref:Mu-like prophage major head subunit gpT family protein n=1 Tax=Candidatus Nitrotoga sp. M5 TaxID=2890409 RepID=UPI001EF6A61C|nr:Mu-like prophage major head subunit gpT family protein [Candidatus Nitrotoga sp. M5]CAH1387027.1 conserved hypothetical protein [Candidatus Nitrotoga sp. M5]
MNIITSRAIIGEYYARLDTGNNAPWINGVSNLFSSDQESETYAWLGMSPAYREWVGGRQASGLTETSIAIKNKHFEATLEVAVRDVRRDKTSQIMVRVQDLADRSTTHWGSLLSTLIVAGESTACYDGQYYFDTDHAEGDSGTQSNHLTIDLSDLPAAVHGIVTAPSVEEMQQCILKAVAAIQGFRDDKGEPMNESASEFVVVVPTSLYLTALSAVTNATLTSGAFNILPNVPGLRISVQMNARLSSWSSQFAVFRTDGAVKGLIRQQETEGELKAKAEGSEFEFDNDAWQFGIDTWRNVGYGLWQQACLVTMVA